MEEARQALTLATFAALWAILAVGHNLADHVLGQTDRQAKEKRAPTREEVEAGANPRSGWSACLAHVAQYHLVLVLTVTAAWSCLPIHLTWAGSAAGLAVSASTHAVIDRRWPVRRILEGTRSEGFASLAGSGVNGMYLADQALHHVALLTSALLMTVI